MLPQNKRIFDICNITKWHEQGITGKGVKIAVFDSKFNTQSPQAQEMFHGKIIGVNGFDNDKIVSHASSVSHIIHQICPDAMIYCMTPSTESIYWCIENDIDIINVSMKLFRREGFEEALNEFVLKGGWMFSSAGNTDEDRNLGIPAGYENCVAVGAVHLIYPGQSKEYIKRAGYSSFTKEEKEFIWQMVEIMGFAGVYIHSPKTFDTGYTYPFNGTSSSSPWDAGMATLYRQILKENNINIDLNGIRQIIQLNAMDLEEEGYDRFTGYGLFILPEEIPEKEMEKLQLRTGKPDLAVVHHTSVLPKYDAETLYKVCVTNGEYGDYPYNAMVEPCGTRVKGRDMKWRGAHAIVKSDSLVEEQWWNENSLGFAFIWDASKSTGSPIPDVMYRSMAKLLKEYKFKPEEVMQHREISATECPGYYYDHDKLMGYLEDEWMVSNVKVINLAVPSRIESGRTLIPLRDFAEAFGVYVHYDPTTKLITMTKGDETLKHTVGTTQIFKEV